MHRLPLFRRKKKIADLVMLIKSYRNILFNWHFWAISELIPSAIFIITSFWSETTLKVFILKHVYLKYTWNYIFEKLVENRSRYEEQKCLYLLWLKWQRLTIVFLYSGLYICKLFCVFVCVNMFYVCVWVLI